MSRAEKKTDRRVLRADLILIASLLLLSLLAFAALRLFTTAGAVAVVSVDGTEVARYPLSEPGRYVLNGGSNVLVIEDGAARVVEADCPDKLCVRQGEARRTGESIVCLPNRLIVTIEGAERAEVDAIT